MGKIFIEQFIEALKDGKEDKAIFLAQFMKDEINEPYDYRSPLFWASRYGNEKVIKALSDMGAVEVVDKEGMSDELIKILGAEDIDKNDEKRAIELIKDGANLEKKDTLGYTALIRASQRGHVEVVKALLDAGAKVNEKNNEGYTALIWASKNGHVEVVEALLDAGEKVNEKTLICQTALILASQHGHVEVVEALLDAGAKVDEINNYGYTALILASERGHVEVVKTLLDAGAKVNEKTLICQTALILASQHGHVEVVEVLLDAGAKVDETNNHGKTAIDYTSNDEIKKLLNEAMKRKKERAKKATQETSENDVWSKIGKLFGRE